MLNILLGTLIVLIPCAEGLLVAADSRTVNYNTGTFSDDADKILIPEKPSHTVVAVTGVGVADLAPKASDSARGEKHRVFDMGAELVSFLQERNVPLPDLDLQSVADLCIETLEGLDQQHPGSLQRYVGREMFSVILATYRPWTRTCRDLPRRQSGSKLGQLHLYP